MMTENGNTRNSIYDKFYNSAYRLCISIILCTSIPLIILFSVFYFKNDISQKNTIATQAIQQLDSYCSTVFSFATAITDDQELFRLINDIQNPLRNSRIENRLMELSGHFSNVHGIVLSTANETFHSVFLSDEESMLMLSSDWVNEFQKKQYTKSFHLSSEDPSHLYYMSSFATTPSAPGYLIISINTADLNRLFQAICSTFPHFVIVDNSNRILQNNQFLFIDDLLQKINGENEFQFFNNFSFMNIHGYFSSYYSMNAHWKLVVYTSFFELFRPYIPIILVLIFAILLVFKMVKAILKPTVNDIVSPIVELTQFVNSFSYETSQTITLRTGDEIEELSQVFNKMSSRIQTQIKELLIQEKKSHKLQYGLYISQVNPHFIYNTMNTINYLARKSRCDDIIVVNTALIQIMRDSLRISDSVMDSLEKELDVCRQYLKIQEYRYPEHIEIIWDIDDNAASFQIPKHILQPIIENSIVHGFLEEDSFHIDDEEAFICISAKTSEDLTQLTIQIEDNGIGIDMDKYNQICQEASREDYGFEIDQNRGIHIGLANIKYRLNYLLEEKQELTLSPRSPHGTIVKIKLYH